MLFADRHNEVNIFGRLFYFKQCQGSATTANQVNLEIYQVLPFSIVWRSSLAVILYLLALPIQFSIS
jgi:hypothetical protein